MDLSGVFGSVSDPVFLDHCHLNDMCYKQIVNLLHDGINDPLPEPLTAGQPLFHLIGFIYFRKIASEVITVCQYDTCSSPCQSTRETASRSSRVSYA